MRLAQPLKKPLLIYDGDCGFCRFWIGRWRRITRREVEYMPFQDPAVAACFPELDQHSLESAVHLISTDGQVFRGAEAVFRSLAFNPKMRWPLWVYRKIPGAGFVAEWGYRFVARRRRAFSILTRLVWRQDRG